MGFGTAGSWSNLGNTFAKALDGDTNTFFDAPTSDGNSVGIDTKAPNAYVAIDLGTLGGSSSGALSINDAGQIVGQSQIQGGDSHAALFSGTGSGNIDLGTLGGSFSIATAINNSGTIVGSSSLPGDKVTRATLFSGTGGDNIDLGALGGVRGAASAVNSSGQIVGNSTIAGDESSPAGNDFNHATLFSGASSGNIDLGTLSGPVSLAYGINEVGQIVGVSFLPGWPEVAIQHATLFSGTGSGNIDLGTLGGGDSTAVAINSSGQIVGYSNASGSPNTVRATLFSGTGSGNIDLGTLGGPRSLASGINDAGQIVGNSDSSTGNFHGFLYMRGVMTDLNALVIGSPATNIRASSINNWGQIAATGIVELFGRALLLNPVNPLTSAKNGVTNTKFVGGMAYDKFTPLPEAGGLNTIVSIIGGTAGTGGNGSYRSNRDVNASFAARAGNAIASDIVNLSGTVGDTFADTIVIQISYDQPLANVLLGSETAARLGWLDPQTGQWVLAVTGNTGGTPVFAGNRAYDPGTDFVLGHYGVDTASNTVWAVIDHDGSFGVCGAALNP